MRRALLAFALTLAFLGITPAHAVTTERLAVILVTFDGTQPWTPQAAQASADTVADYYADSSDGQHTFTTSVHGWYTITAGCDLGAIADQARAAANVEAEHYVYAFGPNACGWPAGLSYMPGNASWLNGTINAQVMAHEVGHQLGLHHAGTTAHPQGDFWTVMGAGNPTKLLTGWERYRLGWLPDTRVTTGDFTLNALDTSGTQLLTVDRGDGTLLALDYREQGVQLRVVRDCICTTTIIDTRPDTPTAFSDAPLTVGRTWNDGGRYITFLSGDASAAQVRITDTPPPTTTTVVTTTTTQPPATTTRPKKPPKLTR